MNGAQRWAVVLMAVSGFAALGYQIVWTQQSALWLGHETAAVLAVIAAFFGGIATGALGSSARIEASARPVLWYAACEAVIGLWSLALIFLMPWVSNLLLDLIGPQPSPLHHGSVVFGGTFLLLFPATAAMGATLPAMERILRAMRADGTPIAILYASNTFGAVLGVLAAAFVLVPLFGLSTTALTCVMANLLCAGAALKVFAPRCPVLTSMTQESSRHLGVLAITGLLGIAYEVLVVRVLSQVAENTVFTFAILLAVYLVGTTLGAAGYSRWASSRLTPARLRNRLLQWLAAACLSGVVSLAFAADLKSWLLNGFGPGMAYALAAETLLAVTAFLVPTIMMGALFSHLATRARADGVSFGRMLGVNTLGAAFAPILCGLLLLSGLGTTLSLLLISGAYLLLASRPAWATPAQLATSAAVVALAAWAPSLAFVQLPNGGKLTRYEEGVGASVSVIEDARGVATLHINNRQQEGSSATFLADARQGLLPILLHPAPRRALFLGIGTGVTARSAAEDHNLHVDAVELLPEVIAASADFSHVVSESENPRLRMLSADARRFVRTAPDLYDIVVADNFHPARSGSGALYTVEHFDAVRDRLARGGVFCQWLPLHQMDLATLRSIVRSYTSAFPRSWAILATHSLDTPVIGLIARRDGERIDLQQVRERLRNLQMSRSAANFGIIDDLALLGSFIASPSSLTQFAGGAPLNTDDRPVVTYLAPRITYAPTSAPRDRLLELLAILDNSPGELLAEPDEPSWTRRLTAYWEARDRFLAAGRNVRPTFDVHEMLAQVRDPLLGVLRISPDFRPAHEPLFQMAGALARSDPAGARELLIQLESLQPARPEAIEVLRAMGASTP
ncbi:MAG TPA: fused MFS/spermidine synthase [Steroidobacteraceae bacterium]|nr:fused MFS/spermidine synthase [Steroidobacteraceae bacterium]